MDCKECKYAGAGDDGSLACRRSPPVVANMMTPRGPVTIGQWPPTRPGNWCGEFKAKIEVQ